MFYWAYYPDRFVFSHKKTILPGPSRGIQYLNYTMLRPAVYFSVVGLTFTAVESFLEEVRGSHGAKDPWNSAGAGFAAGIIMGGAFTKRFDVASMTGLGMALVMGAVELNGPKLICNSEESEEARQFPAFAPTKFEESEELAALKEKYPQFRNN